MSLGFRPNIFVLPTLNPIFFRILNAFECIGEKPFIYGGALRDEVLGITPKDIDIRLSFNEADRQMQLGYLPHTMRRSDLFNFVSYGELEVLGEDYLRFRVKADFSGYQLDIVQDNIPLSTEQVLRLSDAPINSVVFDPDDKTLKTHPDFESHVTNKIYAPFKKDIDQKRFWHLKSKIHGLKLVYV